MADGGIFGFLGDGQARRRALDQFGQDMMYYIPRELRGPLGLLAEANPVVSMERAGTAATGLLGQGATPMQRIEYAGDMMSNMAGVLAAPAIGARYGMPAAQALQEGLLGASQSAGVPQFMADESGALRLFHGSPHDFDRFSMDKIGTGEGAQAYGHGLYFAENEAVARGYRDALTSPVDYRGQGYPGADSNLAAKKVADAMGPNSNPANVIASEANKYRHQAQQTRAALSGQSGAAREANERLAASFEKIAADIESLNPDDFRLNTGRMYEVEVNADPNDFLDWDKPLSEQPKVLQRLGMSARPEQEIHDEALRLMTEGNAREQGKMWFDFPDLSARIDELQNELDRRAPNVTGQEYYRGGSSDDVAGILSQMGYGNPEVQSQALREAGIPGIRYLDAGSRGAGDGSRNYVVFDENLITIVRKYGVAGAAALLGVSQADVAQAMGYATPQQDAVTGLLGPTRPPRAD